MTNKILDPLSQKIREINTILTRMRDTELVEDLHLQMVECYRKFLRIQNKEIETMMYDVENFFEGMEDDQALNEKIAKAKIKN